MPITIGTVTADEHAAATDDKPIAFPNYFRNAGAIEWYAETGGDDSVVGTVVTNDISQARGLGVNVYNGVPLYPSIVVPNGTDAAYNLVADFSALTNGATIDSCFIINHNFNDIGATRVQVIFADDAALSVNRTVAMTWTAPFDDRIYFNPRTLSTNPQWSTIDFAGLRVSSNAAFSVGNAPIVGEWVLSQRVSFARAGLRPSYDPLKFSTKQSVLQTDSGNQFNFVYRRGQRLIEYEFQSQLLGDSDYPTIVDETQFLRLYDETRAFSDAFVWIDRPNTSPNEFVLVRSNQDFEGPFVGSNYTKRKIVAEEIPPFQRQEVQDY